MDGRLDAVQARLEGIAEELADLALDRLRAALDEGAEKAPADERLITRARRSVEKAAHLLEQAGMLEQAGREAGTGAE
ncbi:MAG: hypothetical protein QOD63_748 [Actinomycetota bacterium]|nr:hypothetical protein [Actinomycetota bacterium]